MPHRRSLVTSTLVALALCALASRTTSAADAPPALEVQPTDPSLAKIVLIAGSSAGHGWGEHAHLPGCLLFAKMLKQAPGVFPVVVDGGWPTNPETLKNARAVVFYMDGVGKQSVLQHVDEIQRMVDAGVGIVHLHQVIDYPADKWQRVLPWLGGVYDPKVGTRGHWDATFDAFPEHPVTRGVTPFTLNDGFILSLRFVDGLKGVTPLMRTKNPKPAKPSTKPGAVAKPTSPTDDIVCWTYDRPDGGRTFVLTGGHEHKNWGLDGFRRLVTNGILWSAKVDVPAGGAKVDLEPGDLEANLGPKPPPKPKAAPKPAAKAKEAPATRPSA